MLDGGVNMRDSVFPSLGSCEADYREITLDTGTTSIKSSILPEEGVCTRSNTLHVFAPANREIIIIKKNYKVHEPSLPALKQGPVAVTLS